MTIPEPVIDRLRSARRVAVLTGAGISAESGLSTFRDAQTGLWARFRPEDLATPEAFARNPRLVWEWYTWRRQFVAKAEPNPGHLALVELERLVSRFTLITQNVDGLHQRAGSRDALELHGNITRTRCSQDAEAVLAWKGDEVPPRCPRCGHWLRPDVVWFGEPLPAAALNQAVHAASSCDLFLSIGTSGLVEPAASLPRRALAARAMVVVINPERQSGLPEGDMARDSLIFELVGKAGEVLPALVRAAWP